MNQIIPIPITFNPYKHHLNFIKSIIQKYKTTNWNEIVPEIMQIGNNVIDIYTGKLTINEICDECVYYLRSQNAFQKEDYLKWLSPDEYKKVQISDGSNWIFKKADTNERYIHIHPAKYSLNSKRIKATTLKTVIALLIVSENEMQTDLDSINKVRKNQFNLPPVRSLQKSRSIINWLKIFHYKGTTTLF